MPSPMDTALASFAAQLAETDRRRLLEGQQPLSLMDPRDVVDEVAKLANRVRVSVRLREHGTDPSISGRLLGAAVLALVLAVGREEMVSPFTGGEAA